MPRVRCGSIDCKWNDAGHWCKAKKVLLGDNYIHTTYDGVRHLWECHQYEMGEETRSFLDDLRKQYAKTD